MISHIYRRCVEACDSARERSLELARDTRGAISTEYITLVIIGLLMATAYAGLGVALARSSLRADAVLRSNTP
jgi:hypothetical protein